MLLNPSHNQFYFFRFRKSFFSKYFKTVFQQLIISLYIKKDLLRTKKKTSDHWPGGGIRPVSGSAGQGHDWGCSGARLR